MPKLIKEQQWLLNSAITFNNYPTKKTRKTRNSLAAEKVAKERIIDIPIIIRKDFIKTEEFRHKTIQKKAELEGWFNNQTRICNKDKEKCGKEIIAKHKTGIIKDKNWTYIRIINSQIEENGNENNIKRWR